MGASTIGLRDGTGVIVSNNGSDRRLAFVNANGAQAVVSYFNGSTWGSNLNLRVDGVGDPIAGFAGYDQNFYLAFGEGGKLSLNQCSVGSNCASSANWSSDLNVDGLNQSWVSIFQASDLNVNILSSAAVGAADVNIHHFVRTPNNLWITSNIADGNVLVNDSNRTYNPILRNRDYNGSLLAFPGLPIIGFGLLDYLYLTSDQTSGDPSTLLFDSNSFPLQAGIIANFTLTPPSPIGLDPQEGILNVSVDLNDTSVKIAITDANFLWQIDGEEISTDQNIVRDFNTVGDFNVSFIVVGQDGTTTFTSQKDQNVLVRNAIQGIDITFVFNPVTGSADVNFTATPDGQKYVWGFPNDSNLTGQTVAKSFTTGDGIQVCVVVTSSEDINNLRCEDFFNTHVISKIPIDISDLVAISTPYDVTVNTTPGQAYSQISTDQNFWFFYQNTDQNFFNLTVDANINFLVSTLLIKVGGTDLNQTIQPYVVPATLGISVIFTTVDSITNDIIPKVLLMFNRTIAGVGDVATGSGVTDDLGRLALSFVPNIDHNFGIEFPGGKIIRTGTYNPQTIDATNGVRMLLPVSEIGGDTNATGNVDINYIQSQVTPTTTGLVDLNQIVVSTRAISTIKIDVDHNAVNLFTDTNSGAVASGGVFGQTVSTTGLSRLIPLVITYTITFFDGNTFIQTKSVTIASQGNLFDSFTNAKEDLGDLGGTMILAAFVLALILGIMHFSLPQVDNSHSFVIAALILLFLSFVGYVDGISWVFASLAGGTAYFLRRLDK